MCEESLASRRKPFPVARRCEERDGGERGSLLALLCDGICFRREREREREIEIEKGRGETKIARERLFFLSLLATEFPSRERERGEERETARERGKMRREGERRNRGEEIFPSPLTHARGKEGEKRVR